MKKVNMVYQAHVCQERQRRARCFTPSEVRTRMNRPEKLESASRGADKIFALIMRGR